jgi:chromate reductase
MTEIKLVGFSGSLRKASMNTRVLNTLPELLPDGASLDVLDIGELPLYNGDLDEDDARPDAVEAFKSAIRAADGVVIVSPEYNYGVPGVVKNALDWASRPGFRSPMSYKAVGILGASPGGSGTMRMQEQLKTQLMAMLAQPFPHAGVAIKAAHEKIDESGITDESTREFVAKYLDGFVAWVRDANSVRG